jgi:uncharacterized linocin/CFP29 family protein
MPDVNVDLIGKDGHKGSVASVLQSKGINLGRMRPYIGDDGRSYVTIYKGGDPAKKESYKTELVANAEATLRRDEWKELDRALYDIKRQRLGAVDDVRAAGLTYRLGNPMGTTVLEWHDVGDALTAVISMDAATRGNNDRVTFQHNYLPIPIIHVDYEINLRELETSRNMGNPFDTTLAERAARKILEQEEDMLLGVGTTFSYGTADSRSRNSIYGYLTHPDRNTVNLSIPWNASAMTAAGILQDVLEMKQSMINSYFDGPYQIYIPTAYETVLDDDYDTQTPGTTIRERLLKIAGIKGIKVLNKLTADNVLMVQMTSDVVRLVEGFDLQNVEWKTEGGMLSHYKVMSIVVPQIRSDRNGKCGIVHLS